MNIDLFVKALSDILSEKYGVVVTVKAERRTEHCQKQRNSIG